MGMFYKVDSPRLVDYSYKFPFKEAMIASNEINKGIDNDIASINNLKINAKAYPGDSIGLQQAQQRLNDAQASLIQQIKEHPLDKSYTSGLMAARAEVNSFNTIVNNLANNKTQWDKWRATNKGNAFISDYELQDFAIRKNGQTFGFNPNTGNYEITKTNLELPKLSNANYDDEIKKDVNMTATHVTGGTSIPTGMEINIGGKQIAFIKTTNTTHTKKDFWNQIEKAGFSQNDIIDKIINASDNLSTDLKTYQEYDKFYGIDPNSDNSKEKQYREHLSDALALQSGLIKKDDKRSTSNFRLLNDNGKKNNTSNNSYNANQATTTAPTVPGSKTTSNGVSYINASSKNDDLIVRNIFGSNVDLSFIYFTKDSFDENKLTADQKAWINGDYFEDPNTNAQETYAKSIAEKSALINKLQNYYYKNIQENDKNNNNIEYYEYDSSGKLKKVNSSQYFLGVRETYALGANNGTGAYQSKNISFFAKSSHPNIVNAAEEASASFGTMISTGSKNVKKGTTAVVKFGFEGKEYSMDVVFGAGEKTDNAYQHAYDEFRKQYSELPENNSFGRSLLEKTENQDKNKYRITSLVEGKNTNVINNSTISTKPINITKKYTIDDINKSFVYNGITISAKLNSEENELVNSNKAYILSTAIESKTKTKDIEVKNNAGVDRLLSQVKRITINNETYNASYVTYNNGQANEKTIFRINKNSGDNALYQVNPLMTLEGKLNIAKQEYSKALNGDLQKFYLGKNGFNMDADGKISSIE